MIEVDVTTGPNNNGLGTHQFETQPVIGDPWTDPETLFDYVVDASWTKRYKNQPIQYKMHVNPAEVAPE